MSAVQVCLAPGLRLQSLGEAWVAFSALSGETHQLNDEAALVLDMLRTGPMQEAALCTALAADTGEDAAAIQATLSSVWPTLEAAGLVCLVHQPAGHLPQ